MIRGKGRTRVDGEDIFWSKGDFLTLPAQSKAEHFADADTDAAFYWVHDEPLLRYLGVSATTPRFKATLYPSARAALELEKVEHTPTQRRRAA